MTVTTHDPDARCSLVLMLLLTAAGCSTGSEPTGLHRQAVANQPGSVCITIQRGGSGDIADTQIASNRPDERYGHMPVANIGQSGGGERQALLRADLDQIPDGASIESATLTLWQNNTGAGQVNVHEVLAGWDERTVTWNSLAGAYAAEIAASADNGGPTYEGAIEFDITGLVQAWVSGGRGNHGILLTQSGRSATRIRTGKVGNSEHRPRLDVCYWESRQPQGTSLFVQVTDTDGNPVSAAMVTVDGNLRATDGVGRILLEDLQPGRVVARVEAHGYASASVTMELPESANTGTVVRLLPLGEPIAFEAEDGANLEQQDVRVIIPPNMLVDRNGEPVTGTVEATVVPFDPTMMNRADMPGPLEGLTAGHGGVVGLESLVMAEVSLWQDGQPLQLAPGGKAILELPIPDNLPGEYEEGEMIPAWWFDLDAGIWRQEGEGMIRWGENGLVWTVEVSHFTWWNCDRPWTEKNCFAVTVIDELGNPVPDMVVGANGVTYIGSSATDVTDADGQACTDIMLGSIADIYVGPGSEPLATTTVMGIGPASDCAGSGMECMPVTIVLPAGTVICTPGTSKPCPYSGPAGTLGVGLCQAGSNTCNAAGTAWSGCMGEIVPVQETCKTPFDDDCDGEANEPDGAECECGAGDTTECYTGRPETLNIGVCQAGIRTCDTSIGKYGACEGEVVPQYETCATDVDDNCDGSASCSGTLLWSEIFGGDSGGTWIGDTAVDSTGNQLITGTLWGTVDFGGGPISNQWGRNGYVAKLDARGQHVWSKRLVSRGWAYPDQITVDSAGNMLVVGRFESTVDFGGGPLTSATWRDRFVVKLDANGQHLWSKKLYSIGWLGLDLHRLIIDPMGNVLITGEFNGTVDFGGGSFTSVTWHDGYMVKLNGSDGGHVWSKHIPGNAWWGGLYIHGAAMDSAGNLLLAGQSYYSVDFGGGPLSCTGSYCTVDFVAKLDANGQHVWSKRLGNGGWVSMNSFALDSADNLVLYGYASSNVDFGGGTSASDGAFVVKLDTDGRYIGDNRFSGDFGIYRILLDSEDNLVGVGALWGPADVGGGPLQAVDEEDLLVLKLDASGQHIWSSRMDGPTSNSGDHWLNINDIAVDSTGNTLLTGNFYGTVNLGNGPLTSPIHYDIWDNEFYTNGSGFVLKLDAGGLHAWSRSFSTGYGNHYSYSNSITTDSADNVWVTGGVRGNADLGGGPITVNADAGFLIQLNP